MQVYWSEKSSCGSEFWSNGDQSKEVTATSRRLHVATSPRRDVSTSRRLHVATLQRRDVSSRSAPYHLKYEWFRKQGNREAYERRHGIPEQSDTDFEEVPGICTVFHCLDIFGYENDVFTTKHFHRFIHYVLDLFLGLHRTLSYVMD